jgi:membrane protein
LWLIFKLFLPGKDFEGVKVVSKYTYFMTKLIAFTPPSLHTRIPWRHMLSVLLERFKHEKLAQTAGSLTFTTTMALVPCLTVALAIFTAFPLFNQFQMLLQNWLVQSLIPESIARQVLGYLTQFSSKASRVGFFGFGVLFISAFTMVYTIDRTLNAIWRVKKRRALSQQILLYWSAMTLGPMVLSLGVVCLYSISNVSKDFMGSDTAFIKLMLSGLEFLLWVLGVSALYRYIPNVSVPYRHALLGGLWVTSAIEFARHWVTLYLTKIPTVSMIYGAFATLPILLLWIYTAWLIILIGAVFVSALPSVLSGRWRSVQGVGMSFDLALECLKGLEQVLQTEKKGWGLNELAFNLGVDPVELEPIMEGLVEMDWVGLLAEEESRIPRFVLLMDLGKVDIMPLVDYFLLSEQRMPHALKQSWQALKVAEVLAGFKPLDKEAHA